MYLEVKWFKNIIRIEESGKAILEFVIGLVASNSMNTLILYTVFINAQDLGKILWHRR